MSKVFSLGGEHMSTDNRLVEDIVNLSARAKEFVGEFLYAPLGIESSETLNAITLYAVLGCLSYITYRVSRSEPRTRRRYHGSDFGDRRNV